MAGCGAPISASPAAPGRCRPGSPRPRARAAAIEVVEIVGAARRPGPGLRPEDLLVEVDGEALGDVGDLQRLMNRDSIGRELILRVDRGGRTIRVGIVPAN